MKPSIIFRQYIWLINTILRTGGISLNELKQRWIYDQVADGKPLSRTTFYRHRNDILDMFGIIIDSDTRNGYLYYISNPEVLESRTIESWLLSTLTVGGILMDSMSIKENIILENVSANPDFLSLIIQAIKISHRIEIHYCKFGGQEYHRTVSPYALKLFHRRWYLLAENEQHLATYSLDRIMDIIPTDSSFQKPHNFDPLYYFSEYYGVLTDSTPMSHIIVRAYDNTANYIRTLPLHHSQMIIGCTESHTDFSFDLRPTEDFMKALIEFGSGIEVLEPTSLRNQILAEIEKMQARYKII